jgi:hypothetical protein
VAVEVDRPADRTVVDEGLDRRNGGRAPEGEPHAGPQVRSRGRGGHHRLGVGEGRRERLLAQHVLAGGEQTLDDLAV